MENADRSVSKLPALGFYEELGVVGRRGGGRERLEGGGGVS